MMTEQDQAILREFAARVRAQFPEARIWAFGSRARGDATWESDFDVCVVLNTTDLAADSAIGDIAWEIGFAHEMVLCPLVMSEEIFERHRRWPTSVVQAIVEEGIAG
ncbi:MAG: nucleotidyltransferase domain-containing protein [Candidatus Sumerlaeota bacterium]|nr:nucleotidyltransferase domain-containing protein [Candidatus Sumerlaeota bacterium]